MNTTNRAVRDAQIVAAYRARRRIAALAAEHDLSPAHIRRILHAAGVRIVRAKETAWTAPHRPGSIDLTGLTPAQREQVARAARAAMEDAAARIREADARLRRWQARYGPPHPEIDASEAA